MLPYLAIIGIYCTGIFLTAFENRKTISIQLLFPTAGFMILLAGARGVGWDYGSYRDVFSEVPTLLQLLTGTGKPLSRIYGEKGYLLISVLTKTVVNNYSVFLFVIAIISVVFMTKAFAYLSPCPFITLLFYFPRFFTNDMGVMRQGLVQSIILFSYRYIIEKKWWPFFFLIVAASFIHRVAFIALPLYFICTKGINIRRYFLMVISISTICLINLNWINEIAKTLKFDFIRYVESENYGVETGITFGMIKMIILSCLYLYLLPYISPQYKKIFLTLIIIYIYANTFAIAFHEVKIYSSRLSNAIYTVDCILVPLALHSIKKIPMRIIGIFLVSSYALYRGIRELLKAADIYIPYVLGG
jgi:transmembrane protein EpsG